MLVMRSTICKVMGVSPHSIAAGSTLVGGGRVVVEICEA